MNETIKNQMLSSARSGQSLMEIVIAVALAGIFFGGTVMVFSKILSSDKKNREVQTAIDLANELTDKIKVFADADWHNLDQLATSSVITIDAVTAATGTAVQSKTFQHHSFGDNRLLVVIVSSRDTLQSDRAVSSITYGLGTLIRIRSDDAGGAGQERSELWYLLSPSLGAHNVAVNFGGGVDNFTVAAISFSGVDQLNPVDANSGQTSGGSPGNPSISITTATTGSMVVDALTYGNAVNFNPGSSQVELWDTPHAGSSFGSTGSYRGPISPPQTISMSHSKSGGGAANWVASAAAFRLAASITSYNYYLQATSTGLILKNGEERITVQGVTYTRYYYVENVSRDAAGKIEEVYNASNNDPSTKKVIVRIVWGANSAGLTFHQILTRNRNEILRQTDWSGDGGQSIFPDRNVNNKYESAAGINTTTTSGAIRVPGY